MTQNNIITKIFNFYYDGFRKSNLAIKLLIIIVTKLLIMFLVLKIFFFPNFLNSKFTNNSEKSNYIIEQLTKNHVGKY